jgi:hypothetical protein
MTRHWYPAPASPPDRIVGDRLATPYVKEARARVEALLPDEIDRVTVLARTGVGDWSVRLFIGSELVGASHFNRTIVPGVERSLQVYRQRTRV